MLVTFSGLDGAGKSTLIARLRAAIEERGRRVTVLTMYDHVGLYAWLRMARDRLAGRGPGQGQGQGPGKDGGRGPGAVATLRRRGVKRAALLFDLLAFPFYRLYIEGIRRRVLILDRYFYDSLADVVDDGASPYTRLVLALAPLPRAPILVDTPPEESYKRKGEYSVEHLTRRRALYHALFLRVPRPIIIPNERLDETALAIEREVIERMEGRR